MTPEQKFIAKLVQVAKFCRAEIGPEVIEIYDKALSGYGYENASAALEQIIMDRNNRDPFPSIKEIRQILDPQSDPETEAQEASARIVAAVSRIGPYQTKKAMDYIGTLGWRVVQLEGGWENVCQVLNDDNIGILKAQWRNMAKAQIHRAAAGLDGVAPSLSIPDKSSVGLIGFGNMLKRIAAPEKETV